MSKIKQQLLAVAEWCRMQEESRIMKPEEKKQQTIDEIHADFDKALKAKDAEIAKKQKVIECIIRAHCWISNDNDVKIWQEFYEKRLVEDAD